MRKRDDPGSCMNEDAHGSEARARARSGARTCLDEHEHDGGLPAAEERLDSIVKNE
jgi:hypothetical protein